MPMNTDNLIAKLDKLGSEVETKYSSINCGGCAVFAALVASELRSLGIEAWGIVVAYGWHHGPGSTLDKARKNVSNVHDGDEWNANGIKFDHVGVGFMLDGKEWQYDTSGATEAKPWLNSTDWERYPGKLTVEELEALAGYAPNWNSRFNRKRIPALAKLVAKGLEPTTRKRGKKEQAADERLLKELGIEV